MDNLDALLEAGIDAAFELMEPPTDNPPAILNDDWLTLEHLETTPRPHPVAVSPRRTLRYGPEHYRRLPRMGF